MPGKDFGLGFYLTTDLDQAKRFLRSSVKKAIKNGIDISDSDVGYVSVFEFKASERLKIHEFEDANNQWLHCVAAHRREGLLPEVIKSWADYDIIVGKIANDNTNQVITAYINGVYGPVGTEAADRIAIGLLMPENLTNQICLRTKAALESISYIKADKYSI